MFIHDRTVHKWILMPIAILICFCPTVLAFGRLFMVDLLDLLAAGTTVR